MLSVLPCSAQQNDRIQIDLNQAARWQTLPKVLRSVHVGPDGRRWLRIIDNDAKPSEAEMRAALEKEYHEATPRLPAPLALLESGGRAWFLVKSAVLWGYDGEKWIERKAAPGSRFTGYCPTRGQLLDNLANRAVGGRVWFRDEQGIHVFDGKDWTYTVLCPPINTEVHLPRYAVSPSGKFAVAMTPRLSGTDTNLKNPALWFWEEENPVWRKLVVFWGDNTSIFSSFCITDDGKLWCTQGNILRVLDVPNSRDVLKRLPELIAQLDDANAQIRQRAEQTLDEAAEFVLPQLQAAQSSVDFPEARKILAAIIEHLTGSKQTLPRPASRRTMIGSFRVPTVGEIFQEDSGRILLFAEASTQGKPEAVGGLVLVGRAGDAEFLPIGELTHIPTTFYRMSAGRSRGPILSPGGDALWISGTSSFGRPARRLDFKTKEVVPQDFDVNFQFLQAVDSEGRAFLDASESGVVAVASVGIFSPDIRDERPPLESSTHAVSFPVVVVATDGKVWVERDEGLSRFDGKAWELIFPADRGHVLPLLAGCDSVMIGTASSTKTPKEYALFKDKRLIGIAPMRKLIASYPEIFLAGFPPTYTSLQRSYRSWIATDTQRNIWLVEDYHRIAAFTGEKWIEQPAGSDVPLTLRNGSGPRVVVAVGDGNKVYFSGGLAEIKGEKMEVSAAPECEGDIQMAFGHRDRGGTLWIPCYSKEITPSPFPRGTPQYSANMPRRENRSVRIVDNGPAEELPIDAWPFLIDDSNNVWLAEMGKRGRPISHFWVWREGRVVQDLTIPGTDDMRTICSDKPGSVYVGTGLGLHHLVAEEGTGKPFQLKQTYALPRVLPNQFSCPYSDLAGLVVAGSNAVTFIALP